MLNTCVFHAWANSDDPKGIFAELREEGTPRRRSTAGSTRLCGHDFALGSQPTPCWPRHSMWHEMWTLLMRPWHMPKACWWNYWKSRPTTTTQPITITNEPPPRRMRSCWKPLRRRISCQIATSKPSRSYESWNKKIWRVVPTFEAWSKNAKLNDKDYYLLLQYYYVSILEKGQCNINHFEFLYERFVYSLVVYGEMEFHKFLIDNFLLDAMSQPRKNERNGSKE